MISSPTLAAKDALMATDTLPPRAESRSPVAYTGDHRPHAVVIGAGFGGLAAAIRLGARGYRVTVLDRLDQPGGRAAMYRQDGFAFDAGPTIVTAPFLFEELWTLCGRRMADDVTLKPLDPFYRLMFADGSHMDCCGDSDRMRAEVARLSPDDVAGYERFMQAAEANYIVGFERLGHVPFDRLWDMVKAVPAMARLRADRSLHSLVAHHVRDPRLRTALSFHPLFIGGNPFSVTAIYALVAHLERKYGVHYAMGGTNSLVQGLVGLIRQQGGALQLNRTVSEILVDGGRATGVALDSGERIAADIVVSNACAGFTHRHLLPKGTPGHWPDRKAKRTQFSMSVFVWYFGTNRRYEDVPHHTILLGPRYRELLNDIFSRKVLADDFSLYLHRPSASDASVAPPGHDAFYALVPVPNLEGDTDWHSAAEPFRRRIEAHLASTLLPDLGRHIVTSRMVTPLHFHNTLLSQHGAAFGVEPLLIQSAYFRPHNRNAAVEGLYLVGAGTHPGAGLPGVLSSARILDQVVPHAAARA